MSLSAQRVPFFYLGLVLVFAFVSLWLKPIASRSDSEFRITPDQAKTLEQWLQPGTLDGGWSLEEGFVAQSSGTYLFRHENGAFLRIELHQRDTLTQPLFQTEKFAVLHLEGESASSLIVFLEEKLSQNEKGWIWQESRGNPIPYSFRRFLNLQIPVAIFLLFLMPIGIYWATRRAWSILKEGESLSKKGLLYAFFLAALIRLGIAPFRMVILYIGYDLTDAAVSLDQIPRYGAGVPVFQHGLLELFGADHLVILWSNALMGVLSLFLWTAVVHRLFNKASATMFFAFAWALLPMALAHDTSEANTVPILWWLAGASILFLEGLEKRNHLMLLGASTLATLCMISRPEFALLVPVVFLILGFSLYRTRMGWLLKSAWPLVVATLILVLPQAAHVGSRASLLMERQSLPLNASSSFNQLSFFDPYLTPFALWPIFILAILWRKSWSKTLPWLGLVFLSTALTWTDLCPANIARVQVPAALFAMFIVSHGVALVFSWLQEQAWPFSLKRAFAGAMVIGLAASSTPAFGAIWAPQYEDYEEFLIREVLENFEDERMAPDALLVRLGYGDVAQPDKGSVVHLHFPDYLFTTSEKASRVRDIVDWTSSSESAAAYFFLSPRCYTPERPVRTKSPEQMPIRKACKDIMAKHAVMPAFEVDLPALGDSRKTGYYGLGVKHTIKVGLYRLRR